MEEITQKKRKKVRRKKTKEVIEAEEAILPTSQTQMSMDEAAPLFRQYILSKEEHDRQGKGLTVLKEKLIDIMTAAGRKGHMISVGKKHYTVAKVQGTRVGLDEDALRGILTQKQWMRVTRRVLDSDLLEDLLAEQPELLPEVAKATNITENKPYLKVTEKG